MGTCYAIIITIITTVGGGGGGGGDMTHLLSDSVYTSHN